jgi:hypothetical protein
MQILKWNWRWNALAFADTDKNQTKGRQKKKKLREKKKSVSDSPTAIEKNKYGRKEFFVTSSVVEKPTIDESKLFQQKNNSRNSKLKVFNYFSSVG